MTTPRGGAAAARNGSNAFIVSGGNNSTGWLDSSELYSTAAGTFWAGATMLHKRAFHTANPVTGNPTTGANTRTCETFDTFTFTWSADCDMTMPRDGFTMQVVPSLGRELAAGGRTLSSAELSCHHDKCTSGIPLVSTSSACVSSICSADPFCCTTAWDSVCISEVRTVCSSLTCPESEGACSHPTCTPGAALVNTCDSTMANCVASICSADPFCCATSWDSVCVGEVATICGKNCN